MLKLRVRIVIVTEFRASFTNKREIDRYTNICSVRREANIDPWELSTKVFSMTHVSFLRRDIHTLMHQVSMCH